MRKTEEQLATGQVSGTGLETSLLSLTGTGRAEPFNDCGKDSRRARARLAVPWRRGGAGQPSVYSTYLLTLSPCSPLAAGQSRSTDRCGGTLRFPLLHLAVP